MCEAASAAPLTAKLDPRQINELVQSVSDTSAFISRAVAGGPANIDQTLNQLSAATQQLNGTLSELVASSHEDLLKNAASVGSIPPILAEAEHRIKSLHSTVLESQRALDGRVIAVEESLTEWRNVLEGLTLLHDAKRLVQNLMLASDFGYGTEHDSDTAIALSKVLGQVVQAAKAPGVKALLLKSDVFRPHIQTALQAAGALLTRARQLLRGYILNESDQNVNSQLKASIRIMGALGALEEEMPGILSLVKGRVEAAVKQCTNSTELKGTLGQLERSVHHLRSIERNTVEFGEGSAAVSADFRRELFEVYERAVGSDIDDRMYLNDRLRDSANPRQQPF